MAKVIGRDGAVYIGTNAIAEVRDFSLETSSELVGDSVMGDVWMTNKATMKSWTASINCYFDAADTTGQALLIEGSEVSLLLYPAGNTSTKTQYSGSLIVTGVSRSQSFDGMVEVSFSGTGNGALTTGVVA
jgi:hypothetical protein